MNEKLRKYLNDFLVWLGLLEKELKNMSIPNSERLYNRSKTLIGVEVTPNDEVDDSVACCEVIEELFKMEFGDYIGGKKLISTIDLTSALLVSPKFRKTDTPKPGNIIISPTASENRRGHVGIAMKYGICSNDSRNGLFLENFTIESWEKYYADRLKLPVYFFEMI